jgi:small subunit ribosomal protein S21
MGKHRKKREQKGLRIDVKYNNVEWALKKMKRMVKDSGMILELKKRSYYEKPSAVKREKKSAQAARYRYQDKKEKNSY